MSFRILLLVYGAALATDIFANLTQNPGIHFYSKPALMPILIFYYSLNARKLSSAKFLIVAALALSWLGDVLLLFDRLYGAYFIYGLAVFLAAHIFYVLYFLLIRKVNKVGRFPNKIIFAAIVFYVLAFLAVLAPNATNLIVPLAIYGLTISVMLAAGLSAFDFGKNGFGKLCALGAVFFVVSDSILAINRFILPFGYAMFLIMTTYAVAQLLIAEGSLRNLREIKNRPGE